MDLSTFEAMAGSLAERYQGKTDQLIRETRWWVRFGYIALLALNALVIVLGVVVFAAGILWGGWGTLLCLVGSVLAIWGIAQAGQLLVMGPIESSEPGVILLQEHGQQLHHQVQQLCQALDAPAPDQIKLTAQWNASVHWRPDSLFASHCPSELMIGLPLLALMGIDEFRAVLAHECSHLRRSDWKNGFQVGRICQSWELLFQRWTKVTSNLFRRVLNSLATFFLKWYYPRLQMRWHLLSRHNEFEADRLAAEAVSRDSIGSALWKIGFFSFQVDDSWHRAVSRHAADHPTPPDRWLDMLLEHLRQAHAQFLESKVQQLRLQTSSSTDSHPSGRERLLALGYSEPEILERGRPTLPSPALLEYWINDWPTVAAEMQEFLQPRLLPRWQHYRRHYGKISDIARTATDLPNDPPEVWRHVEFQYKANDFDAAETGLRHLLTLNPDDQRAQMLLGEILVMQNLPEGETLLTGLIERESYDWTLTAGQVLEAYYRQNGQTDESIALQKALVQFGRKKTLGEKERINILASDRFLPHALSEESRRHIVRLLQSTHPCQQAWLVEKQLQYFTDHRLLVLCVDSRPVDGRKLSGNDRQQQNDAMVTSMMLNWPLTDPVFIVHPTGQFARAARQIMKHPEHRIFCRQVDDDTSPDPPQD